MELLQELDKLSAKRIKKSLKETSIEEFMKTLTRKYHVKKIGSGMYSNTYVARARDDILSYFFGFPKKFILKISKSDNSKRDRWADFVKIAQAEYPKNKMYPNIIAHQELSSESGKVIDVSIVEYVNVTKRSFGFRNAIEVFLGDTYYYLREFGPDGPPPDHKDIDKYYRLHHNLDLFNINHAEAIDLMQTVYINHKFEFDLHLDNFGFRSDNKVVVFDP